MSSRKYEIFEECGGGFGIEIDNRDAIKVSTSIPNPKPAEIIQAKYEHAVIAARYK